MILLNNPNFSYYEIDLSDIWQFERAIFLNDNSSEEHANTLIQRIQLEISKKSEPIFNINDSNESEFEKYYENNILRFKKAAENIRELYSINFFFDRNSCYQYDYENIIESNNHDFDYWFALKLRQYQLKLIELDKFLNFQLKKSFQKDSYSVKSFITAITRQYGKDMFDDKLISSIQEWIDELKIVQKTSTTRNAYTTKMQGGEAHSFRLKELNKNPDYLDNRINPTSTFDKAFNELKTHKFIDSTTSIENFRKIFSNKEITSKQKIRWIGTNKELQWFVHILQDEKQKIEPLKNDIWYVTLKCFIKKQTKGKGKENSFTIPQLSKAKGEKTERRDLLVKIIEKI